MERYRLKITEANWHAFKGQLDAATHDELHIGDVVTQCATCNSIFNAAYIKDGQCPCGEHPFVGKSIRTERIQLSDRHSKPVLETNAADRNPQICSIRLRSAAVDRFIHRLNRLAAIGFIASLVMLFSALSGEIAVQDMKTSLAGRIEYLSVYWRDCLSSLCSVMKEIGYYYFARVPAIFTNLYKNLVYGIRLLFTEPKTLLKIIIK